MTTRKKNELIPLSDAVAPVREQHRALIDAATEWQVGRDRQTDPDHFALICAGAADAWDDDVTPTRWTRMGVYHVMRCEIPNWCSAQRCLWPESLLEAMWEWFGFLHATGRLHRDSDPVAELRKPLACYGWLDQDGRKLSPDAPRAIECECFLPYRETAELLTELVRQCEHSGEAPLDRLRSAVGRPRRGWGGPPGAADPDELAYGEGGGRLDGFGSVGLLDDPPWDDDLP